MVNPAGAGGSEEQGLQFRRQAADLDPAGGGQGLPDFAVGGGLFRVQAETCRLREGQPGLEVCQGGPGQFQLAEGFLVPLLAKGSFQPGDDLLQDPGGVGLEISEQL